MALTLSESEEILEFLRSGKSLAKAVREFGRDIETIRRVRDTDSTLKVQAVLWAKNDDPTEEEIAAACAEIQRGWSDLEYYRRATRSKVNSLVGKEITVLVYNMEPSGRKGSVTFSAQG